MPCDTESHYVILQIKYDRTCDGKFRKYNVIVKVKMTFLLDINVMIKI
jgi:hypothetical protein